MIVQACLNGARSKEYHPRLPLKAPAIAEDAWACIASGAAGTGGSSRGDVDDRAARGEAGPVVLLRQIVPDLCRTAGGIGERRMQAQARCRRICSGCGLITPRSVRLPATA